MVVSLASGVGDKATQDKWEKTKQLLDHILFLIEANAPISRKLLESYRGLLVYLQRTYLAITPYVKGYHLTIDSWRPNRDAEGWKILVETSPGPPLSPPDMVTAVPRFWDDVCALIRLFAADTPPVLMVRSQEIQVAAYGFADASGSGFGQTMSVGHQVNYTHGTWEEEMDANSSNFRELVNLVETLEHGAATKSLENVETWIFTDNSASEAVFWKGHSRPAY
jgi:hypothetical protein